MKLLNLPSPLLKALAILIPVAIGAAIFAMFAFNRGEPPLRDEPPPPRAVRSVTVAPLSVRPRIVGHGLVEPIRTWRGVAQVAGRVTYRHPDLEDGRIVAAGEVLLRIDSASYELKIKELEAQSAQMEASLAETETRRSNAEATLKIEQRALEFYERAVDRQRELLASGSGSQAALDQEERNSLQQLQRVQDLRNTIALIEPEKRRLEAEQQGIDVRLGLARLDLDYTEVQAPFDCRIQLVYVERDQYVRVGESLCDAYDVAAAEVHAQLPMPRLRELLGAQRGEPIEIDRSATRDMPAALGVTAEVRLRLADTLTPRWPAEVTRISSTLDSQTRTLSVIARVEDPYGKARVGERPPLVPGMYCEVELSGPLREGAFVAPRGAVQGGQVLLAVDGAIEYRQVQVGMALGDFVVIEQGLAAGDELIISDLVPAIPGTRVATQRDQAAEARIRAAASGREPR